MCLVIKQTDVCDMYPRQRAPKTRETREESVRNRINHTRVRKEYRVDLNPEQHKPEMNSNTWHPHMQVTDENKTNSNNMQHRTNH